MTRQMSWIALIGTFMIAAAFGIAVLREPARQAEAAAALNTALIAEGTDVYAENCAACHGANGEGIAAYPPLTTAVSMDAQMIYNTIERGRYNTGMAAFGVDEGGIFTGMQIQSLVTMLQADTWDTVAARVAELGLTPPQIVVAEIPAETIALVETLPDGAPLSVGLTVYAENCAACHGANGEGSTLAPALNTDELRVRLSDADIARTITDGVPGTLMSSWSSALDAAQQQAVVTLIGRWGELNAAGVSLPTIEAAPLDMSPQAVANGQRLFDLLCTQCHGIDGYGSPIAPALNNQTFLSTTPDAAIQAIIAGGVMGTVMPAWSGYLTDADIAAITAYLRSLQPTAPIVAPAQP
ncbi:MAG: c-type cytochrome [Chloroflexi bacterium]|uniref:c-type cytochrome n=1 Tax=Candidatus Flexifilum breve TaxID=3140694 RepID=UPI0031363C61|nr:c-type cytochrome [Chloroflexota bacterium]